MTTEKERLKASWEKADKKAKAADKAAWAAADAANAAYDKEISMYTATQNETAKEKFETGKDIYVTVLENPNDEDGSIIFETYLKHSSRENVKYFCKNVSERYGKYKIAKVTFVDNN